MRLKMQYIFWGVILCYSYGCAPKTASLQKSVVPPDKTLFETGDNYLKKGQFIKSRLSFQTLINTYPESEVAKDAVFAMADSYYIEGGTENLLQAEDEYKNFIIFYPGSPRADEAQMKIIALNERMMKDAQRDQHYSYKTLREIEKFEKKFSNSDYLPIVKKLKIRVQEVLAQQCYLIGKFYEKDKDNLPAALSRFQEVTDKYKDYSEMDSIYFQMASILEKGKNPNEAANYYSKIVQGYPFSGVFEEAKARLKSLGKEAPSVDTELAAFNQSRIKQPEGFNPLAPFMHLADALAGQHPDFWKETQKTLAADKATKIAEAQAAAAKTGEGSGGPDAEIGGVIAKNSNGETAPAAKNPEPGSASKGNSAASATSKPRYPKRNPD
jgi:outer membrane protein assembly factor BamD